jgi:hypothetical protein
MFDKDRVNDEEMATVDIPLTRFGDLQPNEDWWTLTPSKGVNKGGHLKLRIQLVVATEQTYDPRLPGLVPFPKAK